MVLRLNTMIREKVLSAISCKMSFHKLGWKLHCGFTFGACFIECHLLPIVNLWPGKYTVPHLRIPMCLSTTPSSAIYERTLYPLDPNTHLNPAPPIN